MNNASDQRPSASDGERLPWWRYGMVWLVIAGPAVVVVASVTTGVIAHLGADVLVVDAPVSRQQAAAPTSQTPALQARNHAATAAPR
jgi:uncharacterized protein